MSLFDIFDSSLKKKVDQLELGSRESFARVKQDTEALSQWVSFVFHETRSLRDELSKQKSSIDESKRASDENKRSIHDVREVLRNVPKSSAEVRAIVDAHYNFEPVLRRLEQIEQKISLLEARRVQHIEPPIVQHEKTEKPRSALHEKVMRRLVRNSKEYIKNLITGLVHKYHRISALQLREIVVEEQGLCSKSSFYRILDEMEREQVLSGTNEGKVKVYVSQ